MHCESCMTCSQHARRCARDNAATFCIPLSCLSDVSLSALPSVFKLVTAEPRVPELQRVDGANSTWVWPAAVWAESWRKPSRDSPPCRDRPRSAFACGWTDWPGCTPTMTCRPAKIRRDGATLARSCRRRSRRRLWRPIRWPEWTPAWFRQHRLPASMEARIRPSPAFEKRYTDVTSPLVLCRLHLATL